MFNIPIKGLPLSEYHKKVFQRNKNITIKRLCNLNIQINIFDNYKGL